MNEDGHRQALDQLRAWRRLLDPVGDIRLYTEASHGMAMHAVTAGFWRHRGVDCDQHQTMARRLRESGFPEVARAFAELAEIRTRRWYVRHGNGDAVRRIEQLLAQTEEWSLG